MCVALDKMASKTGCSSPGELEMTRSTSGDIKINETDAVTILNATQSAAGKNVEVTAATLDITVVSVTAPSAVKLTATAASILDDGVNSTKISARPSQTRFGAKTITAPIAANSYPEPEAGCPVAMREVSMTASTAASAEQIVKIATFILLILIPLSNAASSLLPSR